MSMGEMKYKRVMMIGNGRNMMVRWQHQQPQPQPQPQGMPSSRGIRLNLKRFLVSSLRPRMLRLLRVLSRWRVKALQALRSLNFDTRRSNSHNNSIRHRHRHSTRRSRSRSRLVASDHVYSTCDRVSLTSLDRSNSFYAEAIADCLDFIKRSSISLDGHDHHHNYNMPSTTYD